MFFSKHERRGQDVVLFSFFEGLYDFKSRKKRTSFCLNAFSPLTFFLQDHFKLMCTNAMIYNKPETIYYKAAKKLLHSGMKILSQVKKLLCHK